MKKEKKPFVLATRENDIKYRGPLNYQLLRIIGWIAMALSISATILATGGKFLLKLSQNAIGNDLTATANVFSYIGVLAVPLFLLANFTIILNHRNQYLKLLVKFGGLAAAIYAGFAFVILRYANGLGYEIFKDYSIAAQQVQRFLKWWLSSKLYLNVFIDLFLVSLLFYFINYRPKKVFTGKKIYIFRLFVLLPILYEIAAMILKGLDSLGKINLPLLVMPLMPTKPLLMLLCFLVLIIFVKTRERRYLKKGCTLEQFHEYLKTNKSSLYFSIQVSVAFLITAIIDFIILVLVIALAYEGKYEGIFYAASWGIGNSTSLILAIPIVMLFSYNRPYDPKNKIDLVIPLGGMGVVAFAIVESLYQVLIHVV